MQREGFSEGPEGGTHGTALPVSSTHSQPRVPPAPRAHTVSLWPPTNGRAGLRTEYYGAEEVNKSTAPWRTEMQGPVKGKQTRAPVHPRRWQEGQGWARAGLGKAGASPGARPPDVLSNAWRRAQPPGPERHHRALPHHPSWPSREPARRESPATSEPSSRARLGAGLHPQSLLQSPRLGVTCSRLAEPPIPAGSSEQDNKPPWRYPGDAAAGWGPRRSLAAFCPRRNTPGKARKLHRQRTPQPRDSVVPSATHPPPSHHD